MSISGWDRFGLDLARVVAGRSKDPSTQCGAVIMDAQHRVVSTGYNGFPRGVTDDHAMLADRATKLELTLHAEENAILFAQRDLSGCTLYTWPMPPCAACARKLVQVGIARVVTVVPPPEIMARWGKSFALADWLYQQAGVDLHQISLTPA